MTGRDFERANDQSRERLANLVAALTPAQLSIPVGEGWTVASALAHMGFWDRWQADRWSAMLAGTWNADSESVLDAEHLANEALHPYWAHASAPEIPRLALDAATRLDALVASAPPEIVDRLEGTSIGFLLHRHRHRNEHLDQIDRSIAEAEARKDDGYASRNAAARRRLRAIVERLEPADLDLPVEPNEAGSWTVGQTLGHLAFWDLSVAARWAMARDEAEPNGVFEPAFLPGGISEPINRPFAALIGAWTSSLGLSLGREAIAATEKADALIEELGPRLPAGVAAMLPRVLDRSIHRNEHVDQIERALAAAGR